MVLRNVINLSIPLVAICVAILFLCSSDLAVCQMSRVLAWTLLPIGALGIIVSIFGAVEKHR